MLDSPTFLLYYWHTRKPQTGNLSDNPATWCKAQGKGQKYEDKGKTSQEKNKGI